MPGGGQGLIGAQEGERGRQGSKAGGGVGGGGGSSSGPGPGAGMSLAKGQKAGQGGSAGSVQAGRGQSWMRAPRGFAWRGCPRLRSRCHLSRAHAPRARRMGKAAGKTDLKGADALETKVGGHLPSGEIRHSFLFPPLGFHRIVANLCSVSCPREHRPWGGCGHLKPSAREQLGGQQRAGWGGGSPDLGVGESGCRAESLAHSRH